MEGTNEAWPLILGGGEDRVAGCYIGTDLVLVPQVPTDGTEATSVSSLG